jgi:hypothetical protein
MAAYPLDGTVAQTFEPGDVLRVDSAGELAEASTNPTSVIGIAAGSSQGMTAGGINGTVPTGTLIPIYCVTPGQTFQTRNFATDGSGTAVVPTQTIVGETAGFSLNNGVWSVDQGSVDHVEILDVLDANGQSIGDSNKRTTGVGVTVVFGFI